MKSIKLKEYQNILLKILVDFDRVCNENAINYSLDSGTLLGAVRHKGFIPWDDDIDIIMHRKDYEKFLSINKRLSEQYKFISVDVDANYTAPLAKIIDTKTRLTEVSHRDNFNLGAYIDIFVFDNVPNNLILRKFLYIRAYLCRSLWGFSVYPPRTQLLIEKKIRQIATKYQIGRKATKSLEKCARKNKETKYICRLMYNSLGYERNTFIKDMFTEFIEIQFEDCTFKAFKSYDIFLSQIYGDYMKLPPEEKRITNHNFVVYYQE